MLGFGKTQRSIDELYRDDPERADAIAFGRRGALKGASLAAMGAAVGATIPFAARMPDGILPAALAQASQGPTLVEFPGKVPMISRGERPFVTEAQETILDDDVTPASKFFIRNNGGIPDVTADAGAWRFRIDGEVNTPLDLSVGELSSGRFPTVTLKLQMECGGNGRSFFRPQASGNQWTNGAISNAEWTGVRLRDLLQAAGLRPTARFTGHHGADRHLSGDGPAISRGMPIEKAMEDTTILAFRMNGEAIPHIHGAPLRLMVPGWPGSLSQKWFNRLEVLATPHTGRGMGGTSYRIPTAPIVPGSRNDGASFVDMTSMPVRSVLTNVAHGARLAAGTRSLAVRGQAWAGDDSISAVHVSVDFGATWAAMEVLAQPNKHSWQRWRGQVALPADGYYEVWYRATDSRGRMQPHVAGNWNPQGYGANPISRAAILVG